MTMKRSLGLVVLFLGAGLLMPHHWWWGRWHCGSGYSRGCIQNAPAVFYRETCTWIRRNERTDTKRSRITRYSGLAGVRVNYDWVPGEFGDVTPLYGGGFACLIEEAEPPSSIVDEMRRMQAGR